MWIETKNGKFQIDEEDWEQVKHQSFYINVIQGMPYVRTWLTSLGKVALHVQLMNFPVHLDVDHENGDTLDNRRRNLRAIPHHLNISNQKLHKDSTSGFKGVYWNHGKWVVEINAHKQKHRVGRFSDKIEAARAYDRKAVELLGPYARTNEMLGLYV